MHCPEHQQDELFTLEEVKYLLEKQHRQWIDYLKTEVIPSLGRPEIDKAIFNDDVAVVSFDIRITF